MFSFDPEIEGQAYWLDNQTIEFRPNEKLKSGQTYIAQFHLDKLMQVPEEFETMKFGFMVMHQSFFVTYLGMRPTDLTDFSKQEVFGTVRTSDAVLPSELERCFKATQGGEELSISWVHPSGSKTHEYTITKSKKRRQRKFCPAYMEW